LRRSSGQTGILAVHIFDVELLISYLLFCHFLVIVSQRSLGPTAIEWRYCVTRAARLLFGCRKEHGFGANTSPGWKDRYHHQ